MTDGPANGPLDPTSTAGAVAVADTTEDLETLWALQSYESDPADLLGRNPSEDPERGRNPRGGDPGPDTQQRDPCSAKRSDRYNYQPLLDGAPSGVTALLCPQDLKLPNSRGSRKGNWEPLGYVSAKDRGGNYIFNRTHVLGDRFYGSWRKENIFTGFREMNDPGTKKCENRIAESLAANQPVFYSGQLQCGNGRKNVPTSITMTAITTQGPLFDVTIKNTPGKQVTCERP